MLELKLQDFGHLMQRADLLEKTLILGKIESKRKGGDRGWDRCMASLTQWTCVWANSRRQWRTEKPGMLQSMGSQSQTQLSNWTKEQSQSWSSSVSRLVWNGHMMQSWSTGSLRGSSGNSGLPCRRGHVRGGAFPSLGVLTSVFDIWSCSTSPEAMRRAINKVPRRAEREDGKNASFYPPRQRSLVGYSPWGH